MSSCASIRRPIRQLDRALQPPAQEMHETREDPAFADRERAVEMAGAGGGAGDLATAPLRSRQAADTLDPRDPVTWGKVARNAACPCGSGKKFKHCHGRAA